MLTTTLLLSTLAFFSSAVRGATTCNGHAEFCARPFSNVTYIGAHNSYAVSAGNLAANQNYTVTQQLNDGIRMLQVQGHMNNGALHLCHTSCALLDAGTYADYLTEVKSWLDANPNEVISILMVNSEGIAPSVWGAAYTAAQLTSLVYTPPSVPIAYDAWPTLGSLIDAGTRVVNFLAQNADISAVPYLIDEFTNIWETPYDQTDTSFPCTVDRVTGSSSGKMYLINHYLDQNVTLLGYTFPVPDTSRLATTHALSGTGSLTTQANLCRSEQPNWPTFTLVDYYDVPTGNVFQYAATINGVSYTAPSSTSSSGSGSSKTSSVNPHVSSTSLSGRGSVSVTGPSSVLGLGILLLGWVGWAL